MPEVTIKVKWNKEVLEVTVDTAAGAAGLKKALQDRTGVPADRQKVMGVKGGALKDDCADLATVGVAAGKPLMLIGTAELPVAAAPQQPVVFAEDMPDAGHGSHESNSNGLANLGNTCYLNSVIQLLRTAPEFREVLAKKTSPVAKALLALYKQLDNTRSPVKPMLLLTAFITSYPAFGQTDDRGFPMQQDAQEALSSLLQACEQDRAGPSTSEAEEATPLFRGMLEEEVSVVGAEDEDAAPPRSSQVPFTLLQCNVGADDVTTVEFGLERNLVSTFEGTRDGAPATFKRQSKICALPQYVFVHLARFTWRDDTKSKAKILKPVGFPEVLDLQPLCTDDLKAVLDPDRKAAVERREAELALKKRLAQKSQDDDDEALPAVPPVAEGGDPMTGYYELCGVSSHKGRSADGGHYIAWARKNDQWLVFDDDHVGAVSYDDVMRLKGVGEAHIAYVLMYRARDPASGRTPLPY